MRGIELSYYDRILSDNQLVYIFQSMTPLYIVMQTIIIIDLRDICFSACDNKASNYDCEYWMRFGWCEHNAEFMMDNCSAACTRCNPEVNGVPGK